LHRFLAMDEGLLKLTASEMQDESMSSAAGGGASNNRLDSALTTLHEAEEKVKEIVVRRFDEAVRQEDHASIERFFKEQCDTTRSHNFSVSCMHWFEC
jgi:hypothetical protein